MKTFPNSQCTFKVKDREYTINYPNTGQFIDIQRVKATLTGNQYDGLNGSLDAGYARILVDMIATFQIICPKLKEDLKVQNFSDLKAEDSNLLVRVYIKTVREWLDSWSEALTADDEAIESAETANE